jgi:hypothetical protein
MLAMTDSKKFVRLAKLLTSLCCRDFQRKKGIIIIVPEFDVFRKDGETDSHTSLRTGSE